MTSPSDAPSRPMQLMDVPAVGRFLRWRHARAALQWPLLLVAALMVWDGLTGPQLAPKNLATVLTWVHYRGLVVFTLLLAGNLPCMACPFMLVRNLVRSLHTPTRMWPKRLSNKWLAVGILAMMLFAYELFDLWASPRYTAWLILAYFAAALLVDSFFRGATFCKRLCPLGQFNLVSSLISPLEVKVRAFSTCDSCRTKACIKGPSTARSRRLASPPNSHGCELWLFQPRKIGNMDCTFCLDCAHACPHDNVGIAPRLPASELWVDPLRSGIGRFSRRPDLAALVVLFSFGALLNAFGMVTPVYALESWLADLLGTRSEAVVLAGIFVSGLVLMPAVMLALPAWLSRKWAGGLGPSLRHWMSRYAFALVPLGFSVWLAHYSFHFLTGFWTFIPVLQSLAVDILGAALLGAPHWTLGPLLPMAWLYPLELGFLALGWLGSLLVAFRLASTDRPQRAWRIFMPWAVSISLLLLAAIWLMGQPMEMRGTFLVG